MMRQRSRLIIKTLQKCHPYGVREIGTTIFYTDAAPTGLGSLGFTPATPWVSI